MPCVFTKKYTFWLRCHCLSQLLPFDRTNTFLVFSSLILVHFLRKQILTECFFLFVLEKSTPNLKIITGSQILDQNELLPLQPSGRAGADGHGAPETVEPLPGSTFDDEKLIHSVSIVKQQFNNNKLLGFVSLSFRFCRTKRRPCWLPAHEVRRREGAVLCISFYTVSLF